MQHATTWSIDHARTPKLTTMGAQAGWASQRTVTPQVRRAVQFALEAADRSRAMLAAQALCSDASNSASFSRIQAVS